MSTRALERSTREFEFLSLRCLSDRYVYCYSFVCAHFTAHEPKLAQRIADYHHIVRSLLFAPLPGTSTTSPSTIYSTSHLFFLGDLNFRLALPSSHALAGPANRLNLESALSTLEGREELKEFDQLLVERRNNTVLQGMREGEFWQFKCSYKYDIGKVDHYRYVNPRIFSDNSDPKPFPDTAQRELLHGLTGFCTLLTPTLPIPQTRLTLPICYIPRSHRTRRQITYVLYSCAYSRISSSYFCRNLLFPCYFFRHPRHPYLPPQKPSPFFSTIQTSHRTAMPLLNATQAARLTELLASLGCSWLSSVLEMRPSESGIVY